MKTEPLSVKVALYQSINYLMNQGTMQTAKKWQAIDSPDVMLEVSDLFLSMRMPDSIEELAKQTQADLPWSEDHFQERINGLPLNPGFQYQNWPYYKPEVDNEKFRAEGQGLFSHTYMERFWPNTDLYGTGAMPYKYGNFDDLVDRLVNDPGTRQAFFAIWHPSDQSNNGVRLPCTIGYHFTLRNGELNVTYLIRSCDALRHYRNDVYMTIRLAQHVLGLLIQRLEDPTLSLGLMNMWIGSLHCFNSQKGLLPVILKRILIGHSVK